MSFDPDNPLAVEIHQEMAVSYFTACRKMVDALAALNAFDRSSGSGSLKNQSPPEERARLLATAQERVFYVVIQREAMKLSTSDHFYDVYEVPEEVRAPHNPRSPHHHCSNQ